MAARPDFACISPPYLEQRDLLFLFEHFPAPGVDPVSAAARVLESPNTLESLLESQFVHDAISNREKLWLDISPRLFFNVALRRALGKRRDPLLRRTIHYLANLLATFVDEKRLHRVHPDDDTSYHYLVDLVQAESDTSGERNFLVNSHIANYALFLSGVCAAWVEHRHRYRRRPVGLDYYRQMGRAYFARAAHHRLARDFELEDVLHYLAADFEFFRKGLQEMAGSYLVH